MNDAFTPLLNLLEAKYGWLTALVGWVGAFRLAFGWFATWFQDRCTAAMARAASSSDPEDDRDWESLLRARWYRRSSAVVYLLFSVRLPVLDDFLALKTTNQKSNP